MLFELPIPTMPKDSYPSTLWGPGPGFAFAPTAQESDNRNKWKTVLQCQDLIVWIDTSSRLCNDNQFNRRRKFAKGCFGKFFPFDTPTIGPELIAYPGEVIVLVFATQNGRQV